jgi:phospholipid/cholesterol/gamma-HCH transport system substrate-binding protein
LRGGLIDLAHTEASNELDTVLNVFDPPTRHALGTFVRDVGAGAAGHGGDLGEFLRAAPEMLPDLGGTSEALASPTAALPALLESARRVSGRFTGHEDHISQLITQFDAGIRAIAVDDGVPLGRTLRALPGTLDHADLAFRALDRPLADTAEALDELRTGADGLGRATPDLRGVLTESVPPLVKIPDVSERADPAVEDLTKTASDLRPLATRTATALDRARTPMEVLRPYSWDIAVWFTDLSSALAQGDGDKHWLRLLDVPATDDVSGAALVKDPLLLRHPYPAPRTSRNQQKSTVLGGTR